MMTHNFKQSIKHSPHSKSSPLTLGDAMNSTALVPHPTQYQYALGMLAHVPGPWVAIRPQYSSKFSPIDGLMT